MIYLRINYFNHNKIDSFVGGKKYQIISNDLITEMVVKVTTNKQGNMPRYTCEHMGEHDVSCAHIAVFYNFEGITKYCWTLVKSEKRIQKKKMKIDIATT